MEVSLYCYYKEQKHNAQSLMGHRSEKLYNALEGTVQENTIFAIDVLLIDVLLTVVFYIIIQIYRDWT